MIGRSSGASGRVDRWGIDHEKGGWRFTVNPLKLSAGNKIHPTKATYHTGRAMLLATGRQRPLASAP